VVDDTMNVQEIIQEVAHHGGHITVQDSHLKLTAPSPLPDDLIAELKMHKSEVMAAVSPPLTMIECRHCRKRYWHELGHMGDGGKVAGGPCCFGYEVLDIGCYPTEQAARAAWASVYEQIQCQGDADPDCSPRLRGKP
jgi:hypothetical protein